ncbi:ATP-dependent Clp protease adaptor ClpS, partial [Gammaproteobacteria bacterium]|nr:ATP-dependent Clp protease adaptor ClpS [Gammaproteobacteria bacterium]
MKIIQSSDSNNDISSDQGTIVLEDKPELKEPPLYQVVLLNDDFTPMDFVIYILQSIFGYEHERST